jgi:hypothetical protein
MPHTAGSGRTRSPRAGGRSPRWTGHGRAEMRATGHRVQPAAGSAGHAGPCGSRPRRSGVRGGAARPGCGQRPRPGSRCETDDQLDQVAVERRPPRWPGLGPLPGHHTAVPAQQRSRGHDPVQAQAFRQQPGQCRQYGPIGPLEPRFRVHPAQHCDLLAEDQYFGVLRRRRSGQQRQPCYSRGFG